MYSLRLFILFCVTHKLNSQTILKEDRLNRNLHFQLNSLNQEYNTKVDEGRQLIRDINDHGKLIQKVCEELEALEEQLLKAEEKSWTKMVPEIILSGVKSTKQISYRSTISNVTTYVSAESEVTDDTTKSESPTLPRNSLFI
ncbi:hypothetical protein DSO57_1008481 [Entomophthora muscae]|uniref:Uncharacterized protein n=1 Tax=Entomophthora muscae TaxID=34485 RepID=A0ACC2SVX7_9FUNG|nr:hypothetical protein DSO57_1008481 [Entomophthora muscae]